MRNRMPDLLPNTEKPPLGLEHNVHADIRRGGAGLSELHFYERPRSSAHGGCQRECQQYARDLSEELRDARLDD